MKMFVFFSIIRRLFFLVVTQAPFEVEESGWGEFETQITIYFADPNEKPV
jgi:YEATS domain-containing protein 4